MRPNWRSSGVATEDAMVSGLAPGKPAFTEIVGKSTCGRGDTGRNSKATTPDSAMAMVSRVVATGRLMKTSEIFMTVTCYQVGQTIVFRGLPLARLGRPQKTMVCPTCLGEGL